MDIAKCEGGHCHLKNKCFRYTCEADEYQAYFGNIPIGAAKECEYFWPDNKNDHKRHK